MTVQATCPTCKTPLESAGRTERCTACDGAWVHEDVLAGMLAESTSTLVALPWHPREAVAGERNRKCAVCGLAMQPVKLGTVALDRCADHGVWFDTHELEAMFEEARAVAKEGRRAEPAHESHGLIYRAFAKLFGR